MRTKMMIASAVLSALLAGSAQAATIAGWDFSQYLSGGGFLSIDGVTLTNTLDANYSNLDPTFNLGPDSGVFGTMYINGQFGSTEVTPVGDLSEPFLPIAGSLASNLTAPVTGIGTNPFDSLNELGIEGQLFQEFMSMSVFGPVSVVFEADLTSVPEVGENWFFSFGAKTLVTGAVASGLVEFSLDGVNYASVGSVNLNNTDTPYSLALTPATLDRAFVRVTFTSGSGQPLIDNVAIQATLATVVPEPGTALLLGAGLVGLALAGRRRA
jgi:hypothetical protein